MQRILIFLSLTVVVLTAYAQTGIYSTSTIPDSLKRDAEMVVRDEYIKVLIKDKNTARHEVHQVITVLNEQGRKYLSFVQFSDKFHVLDDAEIKVYDLLGNKKSTYSQKEMTSLNYGEGLVPEGKVTYFRVNAPAFPVTVEFNYTIKYRGILSLPGYDMQSPWQSVQHSVFEVEAPADPGVRYKLVNTINQPVVKHDGNKDLYRWEQKNITAFKLEKHSGSPDSYEPAVFIAPNKFQLDDYDGDMTSWKNFGNWIKDLFANTTALPDDKKQFYQAMVKNAATDREKAQILYAYLQNNMRYVSIQLGIGGFRPFPASFVDDKKYGDCKALSNYFRSALDAVGIKSNIVIIEGGTTPRNVLEDFPANYFNHAILCIPQAEDTIWLECTSTTLPFTQLGPFTENRKAMMVTENGGVLVNTPASNYKNNSGSILTLIDVNTDGGAFVNAVCTLKGDERDNLLMHFHDLKEDDKRKYFITENEWKQPDHFEIITSPGKNNPYLVTVNMEYEKIFSFTAGNKLFFEPRLYPIFDEDIPENNNRIRDYYFNCPYQSFDSTVYKFPAGFTLENIPKNRSVVKPFAEYTCTYAWNANSRTLSSVVILLIKERVIKPADYSSLYDFKNQVMASVNEKIVMKKD